MLVPPSPTRQMRMVSLTSGSMDSKLDHGTIFGGVRSPISKSTFFGSSFSTMMTPTVSQACFSTASSSAQLVSDADSRHHGPSRTSEIVQSKSLAGLKGLERLLSTYCLYLT